MYTYTYSHTSVIMHINWYMCFSRKRSPCSRWTSRIRYQCIGIPRNSRCGILHIFIHPTAPLHYFQLNLAQVCHLTVPPVPFPWRCLALLNFAVVSAAPAVSLQDPAGQELILLSLAINAAMMGPFALVENEPPVTIDAGWVAGRDQIYNQKTMGKWYPYAPCMVYLPTY